VDGDDSPHAGDDSGEHSFVFSQLKGVNRMAAQQKCVQSSFSVKGLALEKLRVNQGDKPKVCA
jgi:hypothetical protein